jgi:hypothetical protein
MRDISSGTAQARTTFMNLSINLYLRTFTIAAATLILAVGFQITAAAQGPSLEKITAAQVTSLMQLPPDHAAYDKVEECKRPNSPRCKDRERKFGSTAVVVTLTTEGNIASHKCSEGRWFGFDGNDRVTLMVSLCSDGPMAMPAVLDTRNSAQRLLEMLRTENRGGNPDPAFFEELTAQRTVKIDAESTGYLFTAVLISTGMVLVPTGVVANAQDIRTFVVQLIMIPESRHLQDPNNLITKISSRPIQTMEPLLTGLYQAAR